MVGAIARGLALTVLLIGLACPPASDAYLFGRSSVVLAPLMGPHKSLVVLNQTARISALVELPAAAEDPASQSYFTTLTSRVAGGTTDYVYVTRPVNNIPGNVVLDIGSFGFLSLPSVRDVLFTLGSNTTHLLFLTLSLLDSSVTVSAAFTAHDLSPWLHSWQVGLRINPLTGAVTPFPVILADFTLSWLYPNGTLGQVNEDGLSGFFLNGTTAYGLVQRSLMTPVGQGLRIDLTNGNVTISAVQYLPFTSAWTLTDCSFVFTNATSGTTQIGFLASENQARTVWFLDTSSLLVNILNLTGQAFPRWQTAVQASCIPSSPTQYLLFDESGLGIIDLEKASVAAISISPTYRYWSAGFLSGDGDTALVSCTQLPDSVFNAAACALQWFDSVNASALTSPPSESFTAMQLTANPGAEYFRTPLVGDLVFLSLTDPYDQGAPIGYQVVDVTAPEALQAFVALKPSLEIAMRDFTVDPVSLTAFYLGEFMPGINSSYFVYIIDALSLAQLGTLPFATLCEMSERSWTGMTFLAANDGVLVYSVDPYDGGSLLYRFAVGPNQLTQLGNYSQPVHRQVISIKWLPRLHALLLTTDSEVALIDESLNVLQRWTDHESCLSSPLAFTNADNTRLYAVSPYRRCCGYAPLTPQFGNFTFVTTSAPLAGDWDSVALIHNNSLYIALNSYIDQRIARFTLDCEFVSDSDLALGNVIIVPALDRIYYGARPMLTPVFLDCTDGGFRNVTNGLCTPCPNGSISISSDAQLCMPCPARTQSNAANSACVCAPGYYSPQNDLACNACPNGGVCNGGNTLLPAPGYWRVNASATKFYACPYPDGCNGSDACAAAYSGPLCAVCAPRHALVASECLSCASPLVSAAYWLVAALVYVATFALLVYSTTSSFSILKSFISFAQIVTFPASAPMPHLLAAKFAFLSRLFSLANFQVLSILSPDCLLERHVGFPLEATLSALWPLLVVALLAALFSLPWHRIKGRLCAGRAASSAVPSAPELFSESSEVTIADRIISFRKSGTALRLILFIILLTTPSSTQQLASFFNCQRVADAVYLVRDFTVRCYGGEWDAYAAPVSLLFVLYAIGVPLGLFALLYRYRQTLDVRFLHASYRDDFYWWDCVEQVRKLLLLLLNAVIAPRAPEYYGPCSLAVSIVALSLHLNVQPYVKQRDYWFQCADLGGVTLFFLWSVLPPGGHATDSVAWVYWLFAIAYTAASLAALATPLAQRLWERVACGKRAEAEGEAANELDQLIPRKQITRYIHPARTHIHVHVLATNSRFFAGDPDARQNELSDVPRRGGAASASFDAAVRRC